MPAVVRNLHSLGRVAQQRGYAVPPIPATLPRPCSRPLAPSHRPPLPPLPVPRYGGPSLGVKLSSRNVRQLTEGAHARCP